MSAKQGKLIALRRLDGVPSEMSDEALLAASAVGETAALGALFDRHETHVRRFIARLVGRDARDLDDLVQATFLEVHRSARCFSGHSAVKTWVLGIASNVVRHHTRTETRRRALVAAYSEHPLAPSPAPDDAATHRELVARLGQALSELPHDLRVVFVMCDLEHVAGVEVARVLGEREGTIWRRLHEARKQLRHALDGSVR